MRYYRTAMHSISTSAPFGSAAICTQLRAGKIDLAGALLIILLAGQTLLIFLFTYFVIFNIMGRDYDAAVIAAGVCGFGMGATPNAMANMQVVTKKYGPAPVAYFAIPMVGGMFIDFFNAVLIAANIGWWT